MKSLRQDLHDFHDEQDLVNHVNPEILSKVLISTDSDPDFVGGFPS